VSSGDLEEDIMKLVQGEDQDHKRPIFTVDPIIHFDLRSQATISLASLATFETVSAPQICILVQRFSLVTPARGGNTNWDYVTELLFISP